MGKASSSKKVQRAAKAAGRPGAKKNYGWPLTIGAVVLLGVLLIVLTVSTNDDSKPGAPAVGDHWHAAYGIYDCKSYLAPLTDVGSDRAGIHTHGDGLMHIHPFVSRVAGKGANISVFAQQTGLKVNDTSFTDGNVTRKTGQKCGGKTAQVELVSWSNPDDKTPTVRTKDIAKYAPKNGSVWVLAFVPKGTDVPKPASVANLVDPTAAEEGRSTQTDQSGSTTSSSAPASGSSSSTTATSAPAGGSSSTSSSTP